MPRLTPMKPRPTPMRQWSLAIIASFALGAFFLTPAAAADITVYKTPTCGCCGKWVKHLETHGHDVTVHSLDDLSALKARLGVPDRLQSCHTAMVDGYVVEGHVPASDIETLLQERPDAAGLAVPGMPLGSPGMEYGDEKDPYDVILFSEGGERVYTSH